MLHPMPVRPEPVFVEFPGHEIAFAPAPDTGRRRSLFSRLGESFTARLNTSGKSEAQAMPQEEPPPNWLTDDQAPTVEFKLLLPKAASYSADAVAQFVTSLSMLSSPVAFEIFGRANGIWVMIVAAAPEAAFVAHQIKAHFPEASILTFRNFLADSWPMHDAAEATVVDFGLGGLFMTPLAKIQKHDPTIGLIGALSQLQDEETALYQIIFAPLEDDWSGEMLAAITWPDGSPRFEDGDRLVKATSEKAAKPLFGVSVRIAAQAESLERSWEIVRNMAPTLRQCAAPPEQWLAPIRDDDYDTTAQLEDMLHRRSRRSGMILNLDELLGLVTLPTAAVVEEKLERPPDRTTRPAPSPAADSDRQLVLGINEHGQKQSEVTLSVTQRLQHMHCIGASGTGKSTLLLSMLLQDLHSGRGFALLDPHGDLIDSVLGEVPEGRREDVILIDPSDEQHIVPFNILSAHSDYEKTLLASDLVSVFRRLSTSWGDRMDVIFKNLVLAFLEHRNGGTLADMRRFLVDAGWRKDFLAGIDDPDVRIYWEQTFPLLDGAKSIGPILTRLEVLLTQGHSIHDEPAGEPHRFQPHHGWAAHFAGASSHGPDWKRGHVYAGQSGHGEASANGDGPGADAHSRTHAVFLLCR